MSISQNFKFNSLPFFITILLYWMGYCILLAIISLVVSHIDGNYTYVCIYNDELSLDIWMVHGGG